MSRENQIKELANDIKLLDEVPYIPNATYNFRRASKLYSMGYCKTSVIAKHIFSQIESIATPCKSGNIHILAEHYEELKNKYIDGNEAIK